VEMPSRRRGKANPNGGVWSHRRMLAESENGKGVAPQAA
jgi:hypothetical protein